MQLNKEHKIPLNGQSIIRHLGQDKRKLDSQIPRRFTLYRPCMGREKHVHTHKPATLSKVVTSTPGKNETDSNAGKGTPRDKQVP
jgi:hypothetical protein